MDRTKSPLPGLISFLERHDISLGRAARETGLTTGGISRIVNGSRIHPRMSTIEALLSWTRRYEPSMTYEYLVSDPVAEQTRETPERAVAAAGGRHA